MGGPPGNVASEKKKDNYDAELSVMIRDVYRVTRDVCGEKTLRSPLGVSIGAC